MNRHLLYFTQRVASVAASTIVYALADRYAKPKYPKPKKSYTKGHGHNMTERSFKPSGQASRPTGPPERKPHHNMAEQMQSRRGGRH